MQKISKAARTKFENHINSIERISDLSDPTREHIANLIADGCTSGEIVESLYCTIKGKDYQDEARGWWNIGNGKIEISISY